MNLAWTNRALTAGLFAIATGLAAGCANGSEPACEPACPTFYQCCEGAGGAASCQDIVNNPNNCGGCGVVCPSGVCREAMCVAGPGPTDGSVPGVDGGPPGGDCRPTCSADQRCCGSTCIARSGVAVGTNGRGDPSFGSCNGCGIACDMERASACSVPGGGTGTPRCMCGNLDQCATGELCVMEAGSFTCVSTGNDPNNCGGVGMRCGMNETCSGGSCQCNGAAACTTGQACCTTGCTNVQTDAMNCGMCGNACDAGETCQGGQCVCGSGPTAEVCAAPMPGGLGGAGNPGESCCDGTCVANSDTNCGCGVTCSGDDTCQVGGGGFIPGMGGGAVSVCCGGPEVALLGCGGFGLGDGGFPIPLP